MADVATGAKTGAIQGATAGTFIPGMGTLAGATYGAIVGTITSLLGGSSKPPSTDYIHEPGGSYQQKVLSMIQQTISALPAGSPERTEREQSYAFYQSQTMFDDSTVQAVLNSCNNAINNYNTRIANEGASPVDTTVNAVPDSQGSNPIQDLSDLIKNIAGTTASTYQELINLKASTPTTAATPAPAGTTQSNIYIMIAIVILVVVFFLIRKK